MGYKSQKMIDVVDKEGNVHRMNFANGTDMINLLGWTMHGEVKHEDKMRELAHAPRAGRALAEAPKADRLEPSVQAAPAKVFVVPQVPDPAAASLQPAAAMVRNVAPAKPGVDYGNDEEDDIAEMMKEEAKPRIVVPKVPEDVAD